MQQLNQNIHNAINKINLGKQIEKLAEIYLLSNNLFFITRNFRSKFGEIDLIFKDLINDQIVFIEVKYKRNIFFGEAVCAVNKSKQLKLKKTANYYLQNYFNQLYVNYRFDIISCNGPLDRIKIDWIINAFN